MKRSILHCFLSILIIVCPGYAFGALAILDTAVNPANGHTYHLLANSTWSDAEARAIELGGHLATIRNQAENDWIFQRWGTNRSLWIGLTDAAEEGEFVWASGETNGYRRWNFGEPNNGGVPGGNEDYAYIYDAGTDPSSYWNDYENGTWVGSALHGVVEILPAPPAFCTPAPTGLAGWWRGEANPSDTTGTNHGSYRNGATYGPGAVGQGFNLDGIDDYVRVPASSTLNVGASGNGFTIEAWINPDAIDQPGAIVDFSQPGVQGVQLYTSVGFPGCLYANVVDLTGESRSVILPESVVIPNTWQHVAFTYDATGWASLYLNAQLVMESPLAVVIPQTGCDMNIGGNTVASTTTPVYPFPGSIDEVSLYRRALSSNEVAAIYYASTAGKCLPAPPSCVPPSSSLVSWWKGESNTLDSVDGNNGIRMGALGYAPAKVGSGFVFNGITNHVKVPASSNLHVGAGPGFTVELWMNPATVTSGELPLVEWNDPRQGTWNSYGAHFWISHYVTGDLYANVIGTNTIGTNHVSYMMQSGGGLVQSNVWQHAALTYDKASGIACIYLNGNLVAQTNFGSFTPLTSYDFYLGRRPSGSPIRSFRGSLDEAALYSRALSAAEIGGIYLAGPAGKCESVPTNCLPAPTGLVSWWKGDDNTLDSVDGNNGVASGSITYANAKVSTGFHFDDAKDAVTVPASENLSVGNGPGFTVELWMNPTTVTSGQYPVIEWNDDGPSYTTNIGVHLFHSPPWPWGPGSGCLYANLIDVNHNFHQFTSVGGLVQSNVWQHVALTYDKSSGIACMYLDGSLVAQTNAGTFTPLTTNNLHFGWRQGFPISSFAGTLDEIALYNRALSAAEIGGIYLAGSAGKCAVSCATPPLGMVSWYRAETNTLDSADGNHGANVNGVVYQAGAVGQSFDFSNSNSYVRVPPSTNLAALGAGNGLSIELWMNPYDIVNEMPMVEWNSGAATDVDAYGVHFWVSVAGGGPGCLYANLQDMNRISHVFASSPRLVQSNVWQHVALTYDKTAGIGTIYLNGRMVAQNLLGMFTPQTTYPLYLGRRPSVTPIRSFDGQLDEITFYNRALTSNEIGSIYAASSLGKCLPPECVPAPPGMVSWWRGEDNTLDSADGNHGVNVGGVAYAAGEVGQSFRFVNRTSSVQVAAAPNLNVGAAPAFTVELWMNTSDIIDEYPMVAWGSGAGTNAGLGVYFNISTGGLPDNGSGCVFANIVDTARTPHYIYTPTRLMQSNTWYHVALVYDKSTGLGKIYFNGQLLAQSNLGVFTPLTTYPVHLGRCPYGPLTRSFAGQLDEITIYSRGLTAEEIYSIYAAGSAGKCPYAPPIVMDCPVQVVTNNIYAQCTAFINTTVTASNAVGALPVECVPPLTSAFPVGTNLVLCMATDGTQTNSCTFPVIVLDTQAPAIDFCGGILFTNTLPGQCSNRAVYTPILRDNCPGATLTCTPPYGTFLPKGTNTINCLATDAAGNTGACSILFVVRDFEPPAISCPRDLVRVTEPGQCYASNVTYEVTATDNCGPVSLSCAPPSGSTFPIAITTVTCVATDAAGVTNSCSFRVTVRDNQPPLLVCPPNVVTNTSPGYCDVAVEYSASATENCTAYTIYCLPPSGTRFRVGVTNVLCIATDNWQNTNTCTFTITVNDGIAPEIFCPTNMTLSTDPGQCTRSNVQFLVYANEQCASNGPTLLCIPPSDSTFPSGTNLVNCTAWDAAGNSNSCSFAVTILDQEAPRLVCPANIVTNAPANGQVQVDFAIQATDNCGVTNLLCIPPSGAIFVSGTTPVLCVAADAAGNTNSCSFTVTVIEAFSIIPLVNAIHCAGEPALFSTVPTGNGPFQYTWTLDGVAIGTNGPALSIDTSLLTVGEHQVVVVVSNPCCQATSTATLTVGAVVSATALTDLVRCPCESASFSTVVSGAAPVRYVWRANDLVLPGQTNSSLFFPDVKSSQAGTYSVEVIGPCNSVTQSATLTLLGLTTENPAVFSSGAPISINDFTIASPYPSRIHVPCLPGPVTKVTAGLSGLAHTYGGDIDMMLVSPAGQKLLLLSDAGNAAGAVSNLSLTFDDAAAGYLPLNTRIGSGTFKPTNYDPTGQSADVFPAPAPEGPYVSTLSEFNGLNASGEWALYVVDDTQADRGSIASGWQLTIWWDPTQPIIASMLLTNGNLHLLINSVPSQPHIIEASADLQNWLPIGTYNTPIATYEYTGQAVPNRRFYRVLRCP